jgi:hypothetical protein
LLHAKSWAAREPGGLFFCLIAVTTSELEIKK